MSVNKSFYEFVDDLKCQEVVAWDASLGALTWLPAGFQLRRDFEEAILKEFVAAGYLPVELPLLISADRFAMQREHASGLAPYLFVARSSTARTENILRPTSEIPFTDIFAQKLERHNPLPYRFVQCVTVFRDELTDRCLPFIRQREIAPFIETYAIVTTEDKATENIELEIDVYDRILRRLQVPFTTNLRPSEDTFPEARFSIAFDAQIDDNCCTQLATVHHLGSSFAKAMSLGPIGDLLPLQTSTGISCRALGVSLFHAWLRSNRDSGVFHDRNSWPWNCAQESRTLPTAGNLHACCNNPRCRSKTTIRQPELSLGWSIRLEPKKCEWCGSVTHPMFSAATV